MFLEFTCFITARLTWILLQNTFNWVPDEKRKLIQDNSLLLEGNDQLKKKYEAARENNTGLEERYGLIPSIIDLLYAQEKHINNVHPTALQIAFFLTKSLLCQNSRIYHYLSNINDLVYI